MNKTDKVDRVVEAIKSAFPAYSQTFAVGEDGKTDYDTVVPETNQDNLPKILADFDGYEFVIVWESGSPYQWSYLFPFGGFEEEFGSTVKDVSASLPKGVWLEALNSYSVVVGFKK